MSFTALMKYFLLYTCQVCYKKNTDYFFQCVAKGISLIFCDHLLIVYVTVFKVTKITETIPFTLALLQQKGPHDKNTLASTSPALCGGGEGGTQCLLAVVDDLPV